MRKARTAVFITVMMHCAIAAALPIENLDARVLFVRGAIVVENHNDWDWNHCSIDINPNDLEWDYYLTDQHIDAHGAVSFPAARFRGARNESYNSSKHPPMTIRLACDTPSTGRAALEMAIQ